MIDSAASVPGGSKAEPGRSKGLVSSHCFGAQEKRASEAFQRLLREYRSAPAPLDVSFRQLVGPLPANDLSHSLFPYPARLLRQIPRFFLHCRELVEPGDWVLDPFCGSGTVLVEASAAKVSGWGIDSNPFARLLSRVKTTPLCHEQARRAAALVVERAKISRSSTIPDVVNLNLWFAPAAISSLGRLLRAIQASAASPELEEFLLVCLAIAADRCSLRDSRIPVPVRCRNWRVLAARQKCSDVLNSFANIAASAARRLGALSSPGGLASIVEGDDARQADAFFDKNLSGRIPRPRLVLTSPPYGAAQKYIRSCSLAMGWTGLVPASELAALERATIGREHLRLEELGSLEAPTEAIGSDLKYIADRDPARAAIYATYFRAMNDALESVTRVLSPGGHLIMVAGDNWASGRCIHTHQHLVDLALAHGMTQVLELRDRIRGRALLTRRRLGGAPLVHESVHVLKKSRGE